MIAWAISILTTWSALNLKTKSINKFWQITLLIALSILCALMPYDLGRDRKNYIDMFGAISDGLLAIQIEPIFWIISFTTISIGNSNAFTFFLISILSVYAKLRFFNKYSPFPFASFAIFISYFFIIHELTQIRIGLGLIAFYLSMFSWTEQKKYGWLTWGLIGFLTHYSLAIFLLIPIIISKNSPTIALRSFFFIIISPFISLFLFDAISYAGTEIGITKAEQYLQLLSQGVFTEINYLPRLTICTILTAICFFSYRREKNEKTKKLLAISSNSIIISATSFVAFSAMPVIAYRISDIFLFPMCIIIPIFASNFTRPAKQTIVITFATANIAYLLFYIDFLKP